ncbi:MAG: NmrA family NAD(P)-binding protein [Pseudomonas sp.]
MSNNDLILITGATGATGGFAIQNLLTKGANIRALVRKEDERSAKLRAQGVEVVLGDLLDLQSIRAAMQGVHAAYFVYPIMDPGILNATAFFAEAARENHVKAIVNMSQISARRDAASHAARDHWFSEQVFNWSGIPTTHLRPTFFMEWLLYGFQQPLIAEHDVLQVPAGNGRHAPIAAADQGRLIAAILSNPAAHAGKVYPLFGAVEMNHAEIAAAVSQALGRTITYVPESLEGFETRLASIGMPAHFIQHVSAVYQDYQNGIFAGTNSHIVDITGVEPMTVEQFVDDQRTQFMPKSA